MKNLKSTFNFSDLTLMLGSGLIVLGLSLSLLNPPASKLEVSSFPIEIVEVNPVAVLAPIEVPKTLTDAQLLDLEKQQLVTHLASTYKQPEDIVERIVVSAYVEAEKHDLSPLLILGMIMKESSLRVNVQNSYGAMGLMQVVPRFHMEKLPKGKSPKEVLLTPEGNIQVGTQVLAEYLGSSRANGSLSAALKRYSGSARNYEEMVIKYKKQLERVVASVYKSSNNA